jgi:DNA-binding transcriptional regulator YiaG
LNSGDYEKLIKDNEPLTPEEIKLLRQRCGLSQSGLARLIDGAKGTIKSWEVSVDSDRSRRPGKATCLLLRVIYHLFMEEGEEDDVFGG